LADVEALARIAERLDRREIRVLRIGEPQQRRKAFREAPRAVVAGGKLRLLAGERVPEDVVKEVHASLRAPGADARGEL
jgi:hypothetical protein